MEVLFEGAWSKRMPLICVTLCGGTFSAMLGATVNLECLFHRLKVDKQAPSIDLMQRIHELTCEKGYLREELAMYKRS